MVRAVRFHRFGGTEVLEVEDVPLRTVGPHDVVVEVRAAAINPGETGIRSGALEEMYPTVLPCGEGTDLAGIVLEAGDQVTRWQPGDRVCGWSWERSSHAERVVVPDDQLVAMPPAQAAHPVSWEEAGSLGVAGVTAYAAVHAVPVRPGDTVLVSGATGGVGTIAVQLLVRAGARVLGVSSDRHRDWLTAHGAEWIGYGDDLVDRVRRAVPRVDAVIDLFGPQYVRAGVELGVDPSRIETIISFAAAQQVGAQTRGSGDATSTAVLSELVGLIAAGDLEIPIAARYPLDRVREAFEELERRHTLGKIVLLPHGSGD